MSIDGQNNNYKILMVSLGCDKNLVDTEVMLGLLSDGGYSFTDDEQEADVVIVNTCCFINDAKQESIDTILEMAKLKTNGKIKALLVTGCLSERYREEIKSEIPEVDALLGTASITQIADVLNSVLGTSNTRKAVDGVCKSAEEQTPLDVFLPLDTPPAGNMKRISTTGGYYAYLKIADGCDKHCTYCIIPKIRGSYRSIPVESLVEEAERLCADGAKEIILVAQETTLYGIDLYGRKSLPELLRRLSEISELEWIRILYCYPEEIDDELIDAIASLPKVVNYLDMPIQHASDAVLGRMGRRTNNKELREVIAKLRNKIPDIVLRTTMITGFPGETLGQHFEALKFVKEMKFDRLGVFTYSREEDTPAAKMKKQVPEPIKKIRRNRIMKAQQALAFAAANDMVGRKVTAMIEGHIPEEGVYVARTYKDAPGVDGFLFVNTQRSLMSGDFVEVNITNSDGYDLIGEITE